MGFAPANPHVETGRAGSMTNCRQCHVHATKSGEFVASQFHGMPQIIRRGERLYQGAPPVIPHSVSMRGNCLACHAGAAARPEIRTSHPERSNCVQCHAHPQSEAAEKRLSVPIKSST
jgi:cytochrome c-type protein NapB